MKKKIMGDADALNLVYMRWYWWATKVIIHFFIFFHATVAEQLRINWQTNLLQLVHHTKFGELSPQLRFLKLVVSIVWHHLLNRSATYLYILFLLLLCVLFMRTD